MTDSYIISNHMDKLGKTILLLLVIIIASSCANIGNLSGGTKDKTPPGIDSTKADINFKTNFNLRSFQLVFDEWIVLKNKNQIIVSPPLKYNPIITSRGKKISFELNPKDTLKENTTYVIQFGQSIVDFTEGNPLENYKYIFSTGDIIDSLLLHGTVKDAYSGMMEKQITVMLYDQNIDSIVYKEKPFYVATSDKNGHFEFTNLRQGAYKIIALEDKNLNYIFDPESEKIAYLDSLVLVDTNQLVINMELFLEASSIRLLDVVQPNKGKISLAFNQAPDHIELNFSDTFHYWQAIEGDSILIWYQMDSIHEVDLVVIEDTIHFKKDKKQFQKLALNKNNNKSKLHPNQPYTFTFNQAIEFVDTSLINLLDTAKQKLGFKVKVDRIDLRKISIFSDWEENQKYQLKLLPGAFNSCLGISNDSIDINVNTNAKTDYGTIQVHIKGLDSLFEHVVLLKQKDKVLTIFTIPSGIENYSHIFTDYSEGVYKIELIEDKDGNGKWSPGNYLLGTQSELSVRKDLGKLRKNWDMEIEIEFQPIKTIVQDSILTE